MDTGTFLKLNEVYYLKGKTQIIEKEEIFSLVIGRYDQQQETEVFRNCRMMDTINTYYGCGRLPFFIQFIGDITNDEAPEIILSADQEGGVLKLLIGKKEERYQVLKWRG